MGTDPAREARYWAKVDVRDDDECWPWTACRNPCGYGMFRATDATRLAHRWAYQQFIGPLTSDQHVCHHCDNPACQNPRHWFIGTPADNCADKVAKGRQGRVSRPGESNPGAKLTLPEVQAIRAAYAEGWTQAALGKRFGVAPSVVGKIIRAESWVGAPAQDGSRRRARGTATANAKLTPEIVDTIRARYAAGGVTQSKLGREYGVSQAVVSAVVRGQTWVRATRWDGPRPTS